MTRARSREQLYMEGKAHRDSCARLSHAKWKPPADRVDPVQILEASNQGRLPELIPVRYGRMIPSPFVFYRGAAAIMAADLGSYAVYGNPGPGLWGCPPDELWGVRHTGTADSLRHQRF